MRRIFYLITELDVGGAEKALYELVTRLDRERFTPVVGCLTGRGVIGRWLEERGIRVIYIDLKGFWDAAAWFRLRRALKTERPDVLHTFLFHANVAGRLAAVGLPVRRVISSIRVEEPRRRHVAIERITRGLVHAVTCVSQSACDHARRRMKISPDKLHVIPNGVDMAKLAGEPTEPPREWNLPADAPLVGVIGRLHEQKDPLLMLDAASRVVRERPEVHFAFAGDGPLAAECRNRTGALGLQDNVTWLGWQANVRPLMHRMDLMALSSRWEGMPNVVLEAMACGKPVVATAAGGVPELVKDGGTGILVPPGDAEALAGAMLRVLNDDELRRKMAAAAAARVEESFSMECMVAANEALYEISNTERG